ncbi:tyrosine-type recombinase/integrase [Sulfurimonas microaerophilic]|uniref:tyrosine-type recombinase/integrase n=1 Tax=Sulfurimonas microaerophilic TaxID=3058392 RepID=UPI002714DC75|nr:tyrosine-type recombinase/integrase [Sulfurimonas sp. hsl 1-7]
MIDLMDSYEWSIWLKEIRNVTHNTISSFMSSMEKFWLYSLYVKPDNNDFKFYLANYRKSLLNGYEIQVKKFDTDFKDEIRVVVSSSKPKKKSTINKEIAGIKSYFQFTEENDLIYNEKYINYLYERHKSANSFLSGIQIKKSKNYLETFGARMDLVKPYKIVDSFEIKAFPFELFDELLELASDREKMIYILCAICSARIGQTLNLTTNDIDFENQDVWLISPQSDTQDIYGKSRRKWLLDEYRIDTTVTKPHCAPDLQFKYPIPTNYSALYWLDPVKYKKIFFESFFRHYQSKQYVQEHRRVPRHPFFFITNTGNRLRKSNISKSFKKHIKILLKKYPKYLILEKLDLHSLRHMFGVVMAEHYINTNDDSLIVYTQEAMGHRALSSTMRYFNVTSETIKLELSKAAKSVFSNKEIESEGEQ